MLFVLFQIIIIIIIIIILHLLICMDASLKKCMHCKLHVHSLSHPEWETDYSLTLKFQTCTFQIHAHFNILTVPNWLTI